MRAATSSMHASTSGLSASCPSPLVSAPHRLSSSSSRVPPLLAPGHLAPSSTSAERAQRQRRSGVVTHMSRKLSTLRRKLWREAGPPPDLATRLFSERIMYLKSNTKYGNEHEAIAVYNMMRAVSKFCPIYTLAVGNAFGEAALLLAAGSPGKRASLRSSTIMLRQPLQRLYGMQASDIDIYRRVTRDKTSTMAKYIALHTNKTEEDILRDFQRPRYFNPYEAVSYGLIDMVLEPKNDKSVATRDWDKMNSDIAELGLWDDDEQPLPTNVMYPGTSDYWRSDFDE